MIDYKQATMVLQKKKMCSEETVLYDTRVKKVQGHVMFMRVKNRLIFTPFYICCSTCFNKQSKRTSGSVNAHLSPGPRITMLP